MKIKLSVILPVITALFAGLTLGLFLGRNPAGGSVTVSVPARLASAAAPEETQTEPSAQAASLPVEVDERVGDAVALAPERKLVGDEGLADAALLVHHGDRRRVSPAHVDRPRLSCVMVDIIIYLPACLLFVIV